MDPSQLPEIARTVAVSAPIVGAARLVLKPSLAEIGDHLASKVSERFARTSREIDLAERKVGGSEGLASGVIAQRVLERVFDVSDSDEPWVMEYLAGVIASATSLSRPTDRGTRIASLVASLTVEQIGLHYVLYTVMHDLLHGLDGGSALDRSTRAAEMRVFVPFRVVAEALRIETAPDDGTVLSGQMEDFLAHSLFGLRQDHLLGLHAIGEASLLNEHGYGTVTEGGLVVSPYSSGIELYLWAHGHGRDPIGSYFQAQWQPRLVQEDLQLVIPSGAFRVSSPVSAD